MDVFKEVNGFSAETILRAIELPRAKDQQSYICPGCGKGKNGDGINPRSTSKGIRWHCFGACSRDYSNVDLVAAALGVDERDPAEVARRVGEQFGLKEERQLSFLKGTPARTAEKNANVCTCVDSGSVIQMTSEQKKSASTSEPRNFSGLYKFCRRNYDLEKFVDGLGGTWRGLKYETLADAGCMINEKYTVEEGVERPVMIIPYGDDLYLWREIDGKGKSVPKGAKRRLYYATPIIEPNPTDLCCLNIIVEGEIDALSIRQVVGEAFGVIATGSASFVEKTVNELNEKYGSADVKPRFVVLFDNDEHGYKHSAELVLALQKSGYPATRDFFERQKVGRYRRSDGVEYDVKKVDANDLLQRKSGELLSRLEEILTPAEKILSGQASAMAKQKELEQRAQELKSGVEDFPAAEYFASGQFYRDLSLSAKYSDRKTGFENIDDKQLLAPGIYVIGALPGAGKTAFAWQMLCNLASAGEFGIFCSYEMSRLELFSRLVSRELFKSKYRNTTERMNYSSGNIRHGAGRTSTELTETVTKLSTSAMTKNLLVRELTNKNVIQLIADLKPIVAKLDRPPVVVVDYLQIMPPTSTKATAKEKVDDLMLRLKNFQRETNSTVILISAFNRASGKDAEFESFRESSSIEYSADVVWALKINGNDDAMKKKPRPMLLKTIKNRNGELYNVYFEYYSAYDFFEPCENHTSKSKPDKRFTK